MTRKIKWPTGRGNFIDQNPDRAGKAGDTDGRGRYVARPGDVIEVEDADVADHYLDRGWVVAETDEDVQEAEPEPMDYADFADKSYDDRVDHVEAGDVDHLLDRIEDDDDSQNVQDAVETRRDEIGG